MLKLCAKFLMRVVHSSLLKFDLKFVLFTIKVLYLNFLLVLFKIFLCLWKISNIWSHFYFNYKILIFEYKDFLFYNNKLMLLRLFTDTHKIYQTQISY